MSGEKTCVYREKCVQRGNACAVLFTHLERSVHGYNCNAFFLLLPDV